MSRLIALLVSIAALALPHRARVIYATMVALVIQAYYFLYFGTLRFLLRQLKPHAQR